MQAAVFDCEGILLDAVEHIVGDDDQEAEMVARIATFDNEANRHPLMMHLVATSSNEIKIAANSGNCTATAVAIGSALYSMFMHGLAVGREMERCDIETIAAAKL